MKTPIHLLLLTAAMWTIAVSTLRAQLVADGATNTLDNVTNSINGDVTVGTNGDNTRLILINNAVLSNSLHGAIGRNAGADTNYVSLAGAGTRWFLGGNVFVGSEGSFNGLVITNGAQVTGAAGILGGLTPSSNNVAVVTGPGSLWNNWGNFIVGFGGAGNNQLIVSNGAVVRNDNDGFLGTDAACRSNVAVVTGAGSKWTSAVHLFVGFNGSANQLIVSNGAVVQDYYGVIGDFDSSDNVVVVTGAGSLWTNAHLSVGINGARNRLIVSEGGVVRSSTGYTYVGSGETSSNNVVVVTGAGSLWSNADQLRFGENGAGNQLIVSNGAVVQDVYGLLGLYSGSNVAMVTGAGSLWTNAESLVVGQGGGLGNQLIISDGGVVRNNAGYLFTKSVATVTGAGSLWSNTGALVVGQSGPGNNQLIVSNGAVVVSGDTSYLGYYLSSSNVAVVTGAGSLWTNASELYIGYYGAANQLVVSNGGTIFASAVYLGFGDEETTNINNRLLTSGGTLRVTNFAGTGVFDLLRGTNVLIAGTNDVDQLVMTNAAGIFEFKGGTLRTKGTINSNGRVFTVGDGTSATTFEMAGNGLHAFSNGLVISNNASLLGNGTINGSLTVRAGGTLSPGMSIGRIVLSSPPVLVGKVFVEISGNGAVLTNDQVQATGTLTYGGSLTVSNLGPGALTAGSSFQLFSASAYGGAFAMLNLPVLDSGLAWTNKLLVNGSIEVISVPLPKFANLIFSGTNVIITGINGTPNASYTVLAATNVALPLTNWTSMATNQFGPLGTFSFTNGIALGIPQCFYRIRTP